MKATEGAEAILSAEPLTLKEELPTPEFDSAGGQPAIPDFSGDPSGAPPEPADTGGDDGVCGHGEDCRLC
ncbi:MAG: hypothetical protein AAGI22_14945 [Planctomycetota bacterium]